MLLSPHVLRHVPPLLERQPRRLVLDPDDLVRLPLLAALSVDGLDQLEVVLFVLGPHKVEALVGRLAAVALGALADLEAADEGGEEAHCGRYEMSAIEMVTLEDRMEVRIRGESHWLLAMGG